MTKSTGWVIYLIAGVGLAARLAIIGMPFDWLLSKITPDDAYYYFTVARNLISGLGLTYDGLTPANGYHPLWMFLIAPIFGLIEDPIRAVVAVLGLTALLDMAAGAMVGKASETFRPGSGKFAAILYWFNPVIGVIDLNGLETALAMAVLAAFFWLLACVMKKPTLWGLASLGAAAGGVFLARTDVVLILIPVLAAWWGGQLIKDRSSSTLRRLGVEVGVFTAAGALVVGPWLVWNLVTFGTILQASAASIPMYVQDVLATTPDAWVNIQQPMLNYSIRNVLIFPGIAWLVLWIGMLLPRLNRKRTASPGASQPLGVLWAGLAGALAMIAVHTVVRWYPRDWYFPYLALVVILLAGVYGAHSIQVLSRGRRAGVIGLLGLVLVLQTLRVWPDLGVIYREQDDALGMATWIRTNLPEDAVLGSFNSGILGYLCRNPMINLDGVMSWEIVQARIDRRLLAVFAEKNGRYLVDRKSYFDFTFHDYLGAGQEDLVEVFRYEVQGSDDPFVVYELVKNPKP